MSEPAVRFAEPRDAPAVAEALYESSPGAYDIFAGSRERALRLLERAFRLQGNAASREIVTVAEVDGSVSAAMAAFPVQEAPGRAWAFLRLCLRRQPPWRWPRTIRVFRTGAAQTPQPAAGSLYVDGLATLPQARRRGAARALLADAEQRARAAGCTQLALDTTVDNDRALALYLASGFLRGEEKAAVGENLAVVALSKPLERDG